MRTSDSPSEPGGWSGEPVQAGPHVPAFFLAEPPGAGPVRLLEGEEEHALRVLRLRAGDVCVGLDGAGGRWPLEVVSAQKRELSLVTTGPREEELPPGTPLAPLPSIEVAVAWPRKQRAEDMLGRLVQLGAASITPLDARRSGPERLPPEAPERWWRVVREHMKQCGRLWLPRLHPPATPFALASARKEAALALLEPGASLGLDTWLRSLPPGPSQIGTPARPIVLVVGPEGGFDREERTALLEAGATPVRLGPHVLRVETAAEAALAVAVSYLS